MTTDATTEYILSRLTAMENEIAEIKKTLIAGKSGKPFKLEGLWDGVEVTDEDIEDAKRSVFRDVDDI